MASADILRAAHIETPYQVLNSDPTTIVSVKDDRQEYYVARCHEEAEPDESGHGTAAFIVRACNAHYQMLEALKWFIDDIDGSHTSMTDFDANVVRARAAIAAAEAEAGR